ncbi:MAG TPA: DUF883 family protein [Steroidobacteraceae bacterium]|jgi:ElaB/YqjD/DUF883 family membrane-anchored ribosome-binding protein|nr:DUF883 family protein [Steroidobacteraceae bacterium]
MNDQATLNKLREDLHAVAKDVEALLKATAAESGEKVQEARARAAESLRQAKERLQNSEAGAIKSAREAVDKATTYVKDNPWQSLGIVAAVGVIVGMLLRRRD